MTCSPIDRGKRRRPHSSQHVVDRAGLVSVRQRHGLAAKRIAEPVRGPDPHRRAAPVAERFANLGHEVREIGFGDEGVRPQTFLQRRLGEDLRTIEGERHQQLERLGRQMNLAVLPRQLPGVEIEGERAEANPQMAPWRKPAKFLEVP